jgi:hypothetical protein
VFFSNAYNFLKNSPLLGFKELKSQGIVSDHSGIKLEIHTTKLIPTSLEIM